MQSRTPATAPTDLRQILEAARDRFGAKLNYLEVDGQTAGRGKLPWWWQLDWNNPKEPKL